MPDWAEHVSDFLSDDEWRSICELRESLDVDVLRTYQFHEALVARVLDGTVTGHTVRWDVDAAALRIEVKFATETAVLFRSGRRRVFKWALPTGGGLEPKDADVTVFVGIDGGDHLWAWAVPTTHVRRCASITLTSPRFRDPRRTTRSAIDQWQVPYSQLLPEVLRQSRRNRAHTA